MSRYSKLKTPSTNEKVVSATMGSDGIVKSVSTVPASRLVPNYAVYRLSTLTDSNSTKNSGGAFIIECTTRSNPTSEYHVFDYKISGRGVDNSASFIINANNSGGDFQGQAYYYTKDKPAYHIKVQGSVEGASSLRHYTTQITGLPSSNPLLSTISTLTAPTVATLWNGEIRAGVNKIDSAAQAACYAGGETTASSTQNMNGTITAISRSGQRQRVPSGPH